MTVQQEKRRYIRIPSRYSMLYQGRFYVELGWQRQTTNNQRCSTLKIRRLKCIRISTSFWRWKPYQLSTKQISTKKKITFSDVWNTTSKICQNFNVFMTLKTIPNINQTGSTPGIYILSKCFQLTVQFLFFFLIMCTSWLKRWL